MPKPRLLFLCSQNSARSQMAQAFMNVHGGNLFEAHSAGLEPSKIHPCTYEVMLEKGLDLRQLGHRSKGVWDEYISRHVLVGYLITVCDRAEANCPIYPGAHIREHWAIQDPDVKEQTSEASCVRFREVRDCIEQRVKRFIEEYLRDPRFADSHAGQNRTIVSHD